MQRAKIAEDSSTEQ